MQSFLFSILDLGLWGRLFLYCFCMKFDQFSVSEISVSDIIPIVDDPVNKSISAVIRKGFKEIISSLLVCARVSRKQFHLCCYTPGF